MNHSPTCVYFFIRFIIINIIYDYIILAICSPSSPFVTTHDPYQIIIRCRHKNFAGTFPSENNYQKHDDTLINAKVFAWHTS